jgi:hypothetical protein
MGFVTKDQLERARKITILDYIMNYEADQYKRVGNGYRLKADDALAVSKDGWYCHKRNTGSRTALDYLVEIKGYGLVDTVCSLLGEQPNEQGVNPNSTALSIKTYTAKPKARSYTQTEAGRNKPPVRTHGQTGREISGQSEERAPFILPLRHKDNKRIIAYLQSRGIDKGLIMDCINQGVLYESANWHNCVFVGRDENGKSRFAALRGTTSGFKRDADGSDKKYGFTLPPKNTNSNKVAIFESPIDCLSHQSLCTQGFIQPFDGWRLSLGGTSDLALKYFLESHAEVKHCIICTDNDDAGNAVVAKIAVIPGITTVRSPPIVGNDWNEALQILQKTKRMKGKVRESNPLDI